MISALPQPLQLLARVAMEQPEAVEIIQRSGEIIFVNEAFVEMFGYSVEEALGRTAAQLLRSDRHSPEFYQELEARLDRGEVIRTAITSRRKDGRLVFQSALATPLRDEQGMVRWMIAHRQDLTALKHIESRLQATERLSALGTLAAGVAHEINNPLTWMLDHARSLQDEQPTEPRLRELVEGLEGIRGTVRGLMKLSQEEASRPRAMSVSMLLDRALAVESEALGHVEVRRDEPGGDLQVLASPDLVEALAHILRNAGQASAPGDEVHITTRASGDLVQLWILDSGVGIAPENLPRVMEPFFTTRPLGEGLGLGLSTAENIIRRLGGTLTIAARHRRPGVVVTVSLQRADSVVQAEPEAGSGMKVLIIDDDQRVARALSRLLRVHDVSLVDSGQEALQQLSERSFDMVICDLLMPGMSGLDLFERLQLQQPEVADRFLFTTGGAWSDRSKRFIEEHAARVISKPFRRDQIDRAIALIASRRTTGP